MAGEKKRGAPRKQTKKPSAATKEKRARKLAARGVPEPTRAEPGA